MPKTDVPHYRSKIVLYVFSRAALGGHAYICQTLMKYGVDPNIQDYSGYVPFKTCSPKCLSSKYSRPSVAVILMAHLPWLFRSCS